MCLCVCVCVCARSRAHVRVCVCVLSPTVRGELIAVLVSCSSELLLSSSTRRDPSTPLVMVNTPSVLTHVNKTQY